MPPGLLACFSNTSKPKSKQITIRTCKTKIFSNGMGLKQGFKLSPLLANIYLADLHDLLSKNNYNPSILTNNSITSISRADVFMLLSLEKESLQQCIYSLQDYSETWNLEVFLTKTRCVIFFKGILKYKKQEPIFFGGKAINYVPYFKYLGVEFSQNCEFKKVKQERIIKARNAIFSIKRILCTNRCVSPKLSLSLFDSKILPILTYGCVIWNVRTQNNVIINGVPETTRTAKTEIKMLYEGILDEKLPDDLSIQ